MNDEPSSAIAVPHARAPAPPSPAAFLLAATPARATPAACARIAAEAAAARDEIATVLAAGLDLAEVLDRIGRVSSTLAWVQERVEADSAGPSDVAAMDAVLAARRSIGEARDLVSTALATWTAEPARDVPRHH